MEIPELPELKRKDIDSKLSFQEILNNLIDKRDIRLKTEILDPLNLTRMEIFGKYMELKEYDFSSSLIRDVITIYLENMVSFNRKSRTETYRTLQALFEKIEISELPINKKLITNLK